MQTKTLHVIELFAGPGGSITGYKKVKGIKVIEAYENDKFPAMTLRTNHKKLIVREQNIHDISFSQKDSDVIVFPYDKAFFELLEERAKENTLNIQTESLFKQILAGIVPLVISGGPPCPPYSQLNLRKQTDDPRIESIDHYLRIIKELKPTYALFENVPRLFPELKAKIRRYGNDMGYNVNCGYHNSADFGDLTMRRRWYCIFSKTKTIYMTPTHGKGLKPYATVGGILGTTDEGSKIGITKDKLDKINKLVESEDYHSNNRRQWNKLPGRRWDNIYVANPNLPAKAIVDATKMGYYYYDPKLEKVTRTLNFRELKMIQGFPKRYKIEGNTNAIIAKQIGNANPINISAAFARTIYKDFTKYN